MVSQEKKEQTNFIFMKLLGVLGSQFSQLYMRVWEATFMLGSGVSEPTFKLGSEASLLAVSPGF